jgi:hypothetical protein
VCGPRRAAYVEAAEITRLCDEGIEDRSATFETQAEDVDSLALFSYLRCTCKTRSF